MLLRILLFLVALWAPAAGQQPSEEELAKQSQNPIADLISVPLQSNFLFGTGFHHNKMIYVLNVQPVIPFNLSEAWNLIARIIMPVINQPNLSPSFGGMVPSTTGTGFGDFNPSFFFSTAKPGELIWGVAPTRANGAGGHRCCAADAGAVGVRCADNNQWSIAGWRDKAVNQMQKDWKIFSIGLRTRSSVESMDRSSFV